MENMAVYLVQSWSDKALMGIVFEPEYILLLFLIL